MLRKVDWLKPIADELGVSLSQLAIAWCAANPNVSSVITGATKESQVSSYMFKTYLEGDYLGIESKAFMCILCQLFFSMILIPFALSKKYL